MRLCSFNVNSPSCWCAGGAGGGVVPLEPSHFANISLSQSLQNHALTASPSSICCSMLRFQPHASSWMLRRYLDICRMQAVGKCICRLKLEARMVAAVGGAPGGCSWNGQFFPSSSLPLAARQCPPRIMIQPRPTPFHHSFSSLSNLRSASPTWLWWDPPSRII